MNATASTSTAHKALPGWPLFIALSLLIHLLGLLLWYLLAPEPMAVSDIPTAPFEIELENAAPAVKSPPIAPSITKPPVARKSPEPAAKPNTPPPTTAPADIQGTKPAQPPATVAPEPFDERALGTSRRLFENFPGVGSPVPPIPGPEPEKEETEIKPDDESRLHIESLIRTRFAEHFSYPAMAQSHGWEGEVVLAFRVGPDGHISHIQIERGSGHAILDQAALDSMRSIERIEFAPGMMLRQILELRMPVIYHLAQR